jgi:cell division protease FtsH
LRNAPMSNDTAKLVDREIKALVEGGLNRAKQLLTDHNDKLHLLANALLEYETLSGEEIKLLLAGEDIGRNDLGTGTATLVPGGTSIPKTRRPKGPFGNPAPQGA